MQGFLVIVIEKVIFEAYSSQASGRPARSGYKA
jgi:hypothetical protein